VIDEHGDNRLRRRARQLEALVERELREVVVELHRVDRRQAVAAVADDDRADHDLRIARAPSRTARDSAVASIRGVRIEPAGPGRGIAGMEELRRSPVVGSITSTRPAARRSCSLYVSLVDAGSVPLMYLLNDVIGSGTPFFFGPWKKS
jgi:hypothetical protein